VPVSEPSTTAPLPDGAVDLGSGVHLVVPAGWDIEWDDLGPIITDGVDHAALEVHVRPAGEDPAVALQAYVDGFDADFDAVAYSPVTWRDTFGTGRVTVQQYGLYYTTYAADDGVGDRGGLYALVRADGLTLLIDVWNEGGGTGLPDATADQLRQSLLAAPPVGDAVVRPVTPPFRVDTVHTQVVIDELTGFTLAPGFEVVAEGPGWARASDGWYDVELHAYAGIESLDAAMAEADLLVRERYTDVVYEPEDQVDEQLADLGLARRSLPWTALFTVDGTPSDGGNGGRGAVDSPGDRIRERFEANRKLDSRLALDQSVNQTLSRTIMTKVTTLIVVVALLVLGGSALRGFSEALVIGILVGTYSSIYISSAVALDLGLKAEHVFPTVRSKEVDSLP